MASNDSEDRQRLSRKLAKLAGLSGPATPEGREIAAGAPAQLASALLTEIDETILWRRLSFRTEAGGPALRLDVYGRRLIAVAPPAPPGVAAADLAAANAGGPGAAEALRRLVEAFLAGATRLAVRAEPPPSARDPLALGQAARSLARAWGISLDDGPLPTAAAALDALMAAPSIAWLRRGVSGETSGGAPDGIARLNAFVAGGLDALAAPEPEDGKAPVPRCIVLGRQEGGATLVFAEAAGDVALLLVARGDLAAVTRAWRGVIR